MSSDTFKPSIKEYINKLSAIKDNYIKERIELQTQHVERMKSSAEAFRENFMTLVQNLKETRVNMLASSKKRFDDMIDDFNDFLFKAKYGMKLKYLIICGAIVMSGVGVYFFIKYKIDRSDSDSVDTRVANRRTLSKKSKQYLRDNYSANDEEEEEDALTDFDIFNMYEIQSKQKEFALIYNKSLALKKRNPNKLISIRNNRQMDLNNLLNYVETKLKDYPKILTRPFKTINSRYIDGRSQFRIMQWNGLAKHCTEGLKSPNVPRAVFDWDGFRQWRLIEELVRYNCDIICLQEADFYDNIKPYMHHLGYTSVFCPKMKSNLSKDTNQLEADGCAIFYNIDIFQITQLRSQSICLNGEHEPQVFIIIQLKHKFTKKRVTVVCVHLKAFQEFSQRRTEQVEFLLRTLREHMSATCSDSDQLQDQAVILCGDLNGVYTEDFYQLIMNERMFKLADVYPKSVQGTQGYKRKVVDYIFFNTKALNLMNYLELTPIRTKSDSPNSKQRIMEIPNLEYPSDHFSLVCDFQIR